MKRGKKSKRTPGTSKNKLLRRIPARSFRQKKKLGMNGYSKQNCPHAKNRQEKAVTLKRYTGETLDSGQKRVDLVGVGTRGERKEEIFYPKTGNPSFHYRGEPRKNMQLRVKPRWDSIRRKRREVEIIKNRKQKGKERERREVSRLKRFPVKGTEESSNPSWGALKSGCRKCA